VVVLNWLLGIRPTSKGLRVDPVIPKAWPGFKMKRLFRGTTYHISVTNNGQGQGVKELKVDGKKQPGDLIPDFQDGQNHRVEVVIG